MKYCVRCIYPDTKPDLTFDENGVCSACLSYEARAIIDWDLREEMFRGLVAKVKTLVTDPNQPYHCIVPVSGGKDSHYQIIKVLEYGLRPLAITAITDDLSELGRKNLENIGKLGVDHITVAVNPRLRRRINKYTLETIGDISWAEHVTIFSIPVREALLRHIPLIVWGENPQNEYGGPDRESADRFDMKEVWLNEFGGLNGLRVQDLVTAGIASAYDLKQYYYPSHNQYNNKVNGIFLGQFFPWNGRNNATLATLHGFQVADKVVENSGVTYENLDNYQTGIHDRFKYLKFGFGRATDIACNYIRRGLMSREDGIKHAEMFDSSINTYLGKSLANILADINMSIDEYTAIENRFANKDLFEISDNYFPVATFKVGVDA